MTAPARLGGYRLIATLGHGGMADVFLAVVEGPAGSGFAKLAVVKRLRKNLAEDPEFVTMFMDEARITSRLAHPNVVQVFEVGDEGGEHFLAMEHLDGQPLARIERRAARAGRPIPKAAHYAVIADVLAGLHYAHEMADFDGRPLGVVHRDISPHNVLVTYDGAVKIVDFGIAKAACRMVETKQGAVKGKLRYMAPEQITNRAVDRRCDIFAAGLILWNAATGRRFWSEFDDHAVIAALGTGDYERSPRALFPDVPPEIDAICRKALAFRPGDRYETAEEMRLEIEAFVGAQGATVRRELAATLRTVFEADRAKLQEVLNEASIATLAAGHPVRDELARASAQPASRPHGHATKAGTRAGRRRPSAGQSVAPIVLRKPATAAPRDRSHASKHQRPRRGEGLRALAAMCILATACGAIATTTIVRSLGGGSGAASPRATAVVVSDRQGYHAEPLSKLAPSHPIVKTARVPSVEAEPEPAVSSAPPAVHLEAPATPPAAASSLPSRRPPVSLDANPWAH